MMVELATCSYAEFTPDMGVAVGTSLGHPRWSVGYEITRMRDLAPTKPMLDLPRATFEQMYRARLGTLDLPGLLARFEAVSQGERVVLLCFERLSDPTAWCHRTLLGGFLAERLDQPVPELGATSGQGSLL